MCDYVIMKQWMQLLYICPNFHEMVCSPPPIAVYMKFRIFVVPPSHRFKSIFAIKALSLHFSTVRKSASLPIMTILDSVQICDDFPLCCRLDTIKYFITVNQSSINAIYIYYIVYRIDILSHRILYCNWISYLLVLTHSKNDLNAFMLTAVKHQQPFFLGCPVNGWCHINLSMWNANPFLSYNICFKKAI